ncbi:eukaryotic translation initiation factor 4 gamma 3-like, partial [Aphis craccivora]
MIKEALFELLVGRGINSCCFMCCDSVYLKVVEVMPAWHSHPNHQFSQAVRVQNPGYIVKLPHNSRHYVNPGTHNVSDMKNNHMTNMTHGQIQMVPTHITQRQPAVNLPGIMASHGSSYHPAAAHYPFNPQQASQTVTLMPNVNYPTNQQGMFFTTPTRPLQMTNLPQGPQNPPVANMSNAQNSNGKSLLVQSQSMAMASNAQPMPQVPQQPFQQAYRPLRKKTIIKIIDPNTGREVDLNNSSQGPPTADELAKMKLQTQFQSQVLSAVRKDVIKSSDNNPNYKGEDKVTNEFQSQVKKLSSESVSEPTKAIEIDTQVSEEVISDVEERNVVSTNIKEERIIKTESISIDVGLVVNAEENSSDVKECDVKTPIKIVPSSTTSPEVQIQNTDVINISEDPIISKKNLDKESIKS